MPLFLQDDLHEPSMIEDVEVVELTAEELAEYNQYSMTRHKEGNPNWSAGMDMNMKSRAPRKTGRPFGDV